MKEDEPGRAVQNSLDRSASESGTSGSLRAVTEPPHSCNRKQKLVRLCIKLTKCDKIIKHQPLHHIS